MTKRTFSEITKQALNRNVERLRDKETVANKLSKLLSGSARREVRIIKAKVVNRLIELGDSVYSEPSGDGLVAVWFGNGRGAHVPAARLSLESQHLLCR